MAREPHLRGAAPTGTDRDLHVGWVVGFGGGIAGLILVGVIVCAAILTDQRGRLAKVYPSPSPIPEARLPVTFEEPRLQVTPRLDMRAYREREELLLETFGWADRQAGTARIPIERAMDLYVERGVSPAMTAPEAGADGGIPTEAGHEH